MKSRKRGILPVSGICLSFRLVLFRILWKFTLWCPLRRNLPWSFSKAVGPRSSVLVRTAFCHLFNTVVNKISFSVPRNPSVVTEGDIWMFSFGIPRVNNVFVKDFYWDVQKIYHLSFLRGFNRKLDAVVNGIKDSENGFELHLIIGKRAQDRIVDISFVNFWVDIVLIWLGGQSFRLQFVHRDYRKRRSKVSSQWSARLRK